MAVMDTTRTDRAGMSRQRIIQLADQRTGKIAQGKVNLDAEFVAVLQDFCGEYRWYWRRKSVGFDTTPGVPSYGLAAADNSIPAVDCEQIIRVLAFGVPGTDDTHSYKNLNPILDPEAQEVAIYNEAMQGPPRSYFIDPGSSNILRLCPTPDQSYSIRVPYWAMPNLAFDDLSNDIPLVPGYLHRLLVKGLEAQIYRAVIGERAPAYQVARGEYEEARDKAALRREFTVEQGREWSNQEEAIRS